MRSLNRNSVGVSWVIVVLWMVAGASVLWAVQQKQPTEPLPAVEMVDKKWEVTCALPGQPVREWIVTMPRPLFHPSGHYLLKADGKDLMLPVACTMIEEQ